MTRAMQLLKAVGVPVNEEEAAPLVVANPEDAKTGDEKLDFDDIETIGIAIANIIDSLDDIPQNVEDLIDNYLGDVDPDGNQDIEDAVLLMPLDTAQDFYDQLTQMLNTSGIDYSDEQID